MLCQHCGKQEANRHYRTTIDGETTETHLCAACAISTGFDAEFHQNFPGMTPDMPSILSEMIGLRAPKGQYFASVCPSCGSSLSDISQTGQAGCAQCYENFQSLFIPYVQKVHGNVAHNGRVPMNQRAQLKRKNDLGRLETQLQEAIKEQAFERAAELRDEIRRIQGEASV